MVIWKVSWASQDIGRVLWGFPGFYKGLIGYLRL